MHSQEITRYAVGIVVTVHTHVRNRCVDRPIGHHVIDNISARSISDAITSALFAAKAIHHEITRVDFEVAWVGPDCPEVRERCEDEASKLALRMMPAHTDRKPRRTR